MNEHIFALDIGTQSVTGIILKKKDGTFEVCDFYTKQHNERTMLDGQIQNVIEVAKVITEVKKSLEEKYGPLKEVCVAAAGRSLKTMKAEATVKLTEQPISNEEEVKLLELSAVQQAQLNLASEKEASFSDYHCVGYSVLHYKLDQDIIGSFIDQVGNEATVEIIATFLPKIVVESLLSALERSGLQMKALTLEPIAAIHVLIPQSMRRLNVALIDIGAGTSDVAIANEGTITAYGMVPVAGDEVTEKLSDHFLLDFKDAEQLKQTVVNEKVATIQDILGFDVQVTYDELNEIVSDTVDDFTKLLANKIQTLNNKSPQAVMLIGGGSLTPHIETRLAEHLQLPHNRVAIRGVEAIQQVKNLALLPEGPHFVTPVGIAVNATENPFQYMNVTVNNRTFFMFAMDELTVADSLIQAGIDVNDYYGKIGLGYYITYNGKQKVLRGSHGNPPTLRLNGQETSVNERINDGDYIQISHGEDGSSPRVTIEQLVGKEKLYPITITLNGKEQTILPNIIVNKKQQDKNYTIKDNDQIVVSEEYIVKDLLKKTENQTFFQEAAHVFINGEKIEVKQTEPQFLVNGRKATEYTRIFDRDDVEIIPAEKFTCQSLLKEIGMTLYDTIEVTFNDQPVTLKQKRYNIIRNDEPIEETTPLSYGDKLHITEIASSPFIFQDVFRYVDLNLEQIKGNYEILLNDAPASFNHSLTNGDRLVITSKS